MNKIVILLLASMSVGVAGQAFAQTSGITRAEVKQQLVQAEAQGLLPSNGTDYPPRASSIARNKAAYVARHEGNVAHQSYGGTADSRVSSD